MKAGQLPNLEKLSDQGRIQRPRHERPAAEPGRLGHLHQRRGARLARHLRLHPPAPPGAVRPVLLGRRDPPRRGGLGDRRPPAPARFLAVQPQAARHRPAAAGDAVLGLPRRRGRPLDLLRPALQLPRQPVALRPPPLHLRHGHARHAGHLRHLSVLRRGRPREPLDEGGGKRIQADVRERHGPAPRSSARTNSLLKTPVPITIEFLVHRDREANAAVIEVQGQRIVLKAGEWSRWTQAELRALDARSPAEQRRQRHLPVLPPGSRARTSGST